MLEVVVDGARKFRVPLRPNFVFAPDGGQVSIRELTDEQIFAIGMAWTKALQDDARAKRARGGK
jgi:hypothetical protein